jgi:EAL domain-containing protein (putative c-di-GMP-specific phosphodiesterase class I)
MMAGEPFPADRILVDEAGIESAIWGAFRLKSAYQTIFRRDGEMLLPFAAEAHTFVQLHGSAVPAALFELTREKRSLLGRIGRAIHVGNLQNVAAGLELFLPLDADAFGEPLDEEIEALGQRLAENAIEPAQLSFILRAHAEVAEELLAGFAAAMRGQGMRICLEETGPVFSAPSLLAALAPEFFRVGADRLKMLAREPQVQRMVRSMFSSLTERGIDTLVTGIDGSDDLVAALNAGAACFQGSLLAEPRLAGTLFDLRPLSIEALRGVRDNVVPLFAGRLSSN